MNTSGFQDQCTFLDSKVMMISLFSILASLASPAAQQPPTRPPLALSEVEACHIELGDVEMARSGRWAGQVAVYDAVSDRTGAIVSLTRRVIAGREHTPKLAHLEQLEDCVRRWRFGGV